MARTAGTAIREDLEASNRFLFTSESVGEGHPDKICDQISDHILDAVIAQDPTAHVAVETAVKTGLVLLFGEVTTHARVDYPQVVRDVLKEIGYDRADKGMDYRGANVLVSIGNQPVEIKECVDERWGAGDQGIMFGYATDETPEMMPLTILLAHKLNRRLACCRRDGTLPYLRPDSKTQVTIEYQNGGGAVTPLRIDAVVISQQHDPDISVGRIKADLMEHVVKPVLVPTGLLDKDTKFHIQPSGSFVMGGPQGDAGLTGRKIIVDSYGGWGAHGGGAFSGKDWTKVDRSAAYAARWIAKSIVAAGLARRILIQLSYTIGVPEPVSIHVDTYGTSTLSRKQLLHLIRTNFDLTPHGIMKALGLDKPIYSATACYGHFGREEFPWEKVKPLQAVDGIIGR